MPIYIKRGDLRPLLELTLTEAGERVDLSAADDVLLIVRKGNDDPIIDREPMEVGNQADDATKGDVSYAWRSEDTDRAGTYHLEVEVQWPNTEPQTFPTKGHETLVIWADLG